MENMPMVTPSRCRLCEVKDSKIAGLQRDLEQAIRERDQLAAKALAYGETIENICVKVLGWTPVEEDPGPGMWGDQKISDVILEQKQRIEAERDEARRALREAKESGDRLALLVTAACDLIRVNSLYEYTATWDETTCDGYCFLDDAKIALHEWKRDAAAHAAKEE